jgi:hypothetical protein
VSHAARVGSAALGRLLRAACAAAFLAFTVLLLHALLFSADVAFLVGGPGTWIAAPRPVDTQLVAVDPSSPPVIDFVRRFAASRGDQASLELRALRTFTASLNGRALADPEPSASWRKARRFDVTDALRDGRNELRVAVSNAKGPPLLQARLDVGERTIVTDTEWQVSTPGANPRPAGRADDTRLHPDAYTMPEPGQALARSAVPFGLGLLVCLGIVLAADTLRPAWLRSQAVPLAFAFALVFWIFVFATKTASLPAIMGFDAPAHMHYIELIRTGHRLPLADEGFSTYHPPIAHAMSALIAGVTGTTPTSPWAGVVHRIVPFLSGLACVIFAGLTACRLWPEDDRRAAVATLFAAVIPVGVYMAAYIGNESLHAAWIAAALFFATRIMTDDRARTRDLVGLGVLLSLALLTKFTSLALAPLIVAFVLAKLLFLERRSGREVARIGAALAAGMAGLAGWFYLRSFIHFGDAVVWNLDIPGAPSWWLQPGFHTPAWLFTFGEGVRHPIFAGFSSFWDGLYSTFWGDGLVAGMQTARTRHGAWNETFMSVGYWLALPATIPIVYGTGRALGAATRRGATPDGRTLARMLLAAVVLALLASSLLLSLRLPFYAQARASYLLAALGPIAILGADGFVALDERLPASLERPGRVGLWGFALALLAVLAGSFLL